MQIGEEYDYESCTAFLCEACIMRACEAMKEIPLEERQKQTIQFSNGETYDVTIILSPQTETMPSRAEVIIEPDGISIGGCVAFGNEPDVVYTYIFPCDEQTVEAAKMEFVSQIEQLREKNGYYEEIANEQN